MGDLGYKEMKPEPQEYAEGKTDTEDTYTELSSPVPVADGACTDALNNENDEATIHADVMEALMGIFDDGFGATPFAEEGDDHNKAETSNQCKDTELSAGFPSTSTESGVDVNIAKTIESEEQVQKSVNFTKKSKSVSVPETDLHTADTLSCTSSGVSIEAKKEMLAEHLTDDYETPNKKAKVISDGSSENSSPSFSMNTRRPPSNTLELDPKSQSKTEVRLINITRVIGEGTQFMLDPQLCNLLDVTCGPALDRQLKPEWFERTNNFFYTNVPASITSAIPPKIPGNGILTLPRITPMPMPHNIISDSESTKNSTTKLPSPPILERSRNISREEALAKGLCAVSEDIQIDPLKPISRFGRVIKPSKGMQDFVQDLDLGTELGGESQIAIAMIDRQPNTNISGALHLPQPRRLTSEVKIGDSTKKCNGPIQIPHNGGSVNHSRNRKSSSTGSSEEDKDCTRQSSHNDETPEEEDDDDEDVQMPTLTKYDCLSASPLSCGAIDTIQPQTEPEKVENREQSLKEKYLNGRKVEELQRRINKLERVIKKRSPKKEDHQESRMQSKQKSCTIRRKGSPVAKAANGLNMATKEKKLNEGSKELSPMKIPTLKIKLGGVNKDQYKILPTVENEIEIKDENESQSQPTQQKQQHEQAKVEWAESEPVSDTKPSLPSTPQHIEAKVESKPIGEEGHSLALPSNQLEEKHSLRPRRKTENAVNEVKPPCKTAVADHKFKEPLPAKKASCASKLFKGKRISGAIRRHSCPVVATRKRPLEATVNHSSKMKKDACAIEEEKLDHELAIKANVLSGNQVQVRLRRVSARTAAAKQKAVDAADEEKCVLTNASNSKASDIREKKNLKEKIFCKPPSPPVVTKGANLDQPSTSRVSRARVGESTIVNYEGINVRGTVVEPEGLGGDYDETADPIVCFDKTLLKDHMYIISQEGFELKVMMFDGIRFRPVTQEFFISALNDAKEQAQALIESMEPETTDTESTDT